MDIIRTFEIFLRAPLSVLRDGFIQIMHIEPDGTGFEHEKAINVDFLSDKTQITVVNNKKVYSLLRMVTYRAKQRELELQKNQRKVAIR